MDTPPCLLLVEDDPASREFLATALEALPVRLSVATRMAEALLAPPQDLYLIDANLPDGNGVDLLAELQRRAWPVLAIAHTADTSADRHADLLGAGFAQVLVKPLPATELCNAVARLLQLPSITSANSSLPAPAEVSPLWDDVRALAALNGHATHVASLRDLFLDDLGKQMLDIRKGAEAGDPTAIRHILHRLKASCGFVGAARLHAAAIALEEAPLAPKQLEEFLETARLTQESGR